MAFNGWTNWQTWSVATIIANNWKVYNRVTNFLEQETRGQVHVVIKEICSSMGVCCDDKEINWVEIAEAYKSHAKELKK